MLLGFGTDQNVLQELIIAQQICKLKGIQLGEFSPFSFAFNLSQLGPSLEKITYGKLAAGRIFPILDRVPEIYSKKDAIKPEQIEGKIKFQNVTFSYPKNKEKIIL